MSYNTSRAQMERLKQVNKQLAQLIDELSGELPEPSPQVKKRFADFNLERKCLYCEKLLKLDEKNSRGCHPRCYHKLNRLVSSGKTTAHELYLSGKWNEGADPGRPPDDQSNVPVIKDLSEAGRNAALKGAVDSAKAKKKSPTKK